MALGLAGCTDPLGRIDARTAELMAARSTAIGARPLAVPRPPLSEAGINRRSYDRTEPGTVNPPAEQLQYAPARQQQTDREVADRLAGYAAEANALGAVGEDAGAEAEGTLELTLPDAWRYAQATGREFLRAEEDYLLSAIRVLQERHLYSPRFFNTTRGELGGVGRDGRFEHATTIINTLRATQRLPNGGNLEASWIVRATDQLRERATDGYVQSSTLALSADIPLLRGAGPAAREGLIQAERSLIYQARTFERSRRSLLVSVAVDFFNLVEQRARIENQQRQLQSLRNLLASTEAKVTAGRLRPFQKDLAANQVLRGEASLASQRESYALALDRFKIRLGLPVSTPLAIEEPELELPEPAISQVDAASLALDYRLDLQNERDQLDDQRRAVRNARNGLLPDLDLSGSLGIPTETDDPTGGLSIDTDDLDYSVAVSLGLPLDREIERLSLRSSIISLERAARAFDDFRDELIVAARQSVREIDLSRFQLLLAERQVEINERRLEDLSLRDDVDPQSIVDAENELIDARNALDSARTDLRTAVLNHLLDTGQLRVARDGTLEPLPGM